MITGSGLFGFETWMYGPHGAKQKQLNKVKNARAYSNTRAILSNLAINTFEWEGLPESVNVFFLEWSFLIRGCCAIGYDEDYGYVGLPFTSEAKLNIYGESPTILMYGGNGYNKRFNAFIRGSYNENANAVKGYDNMLGYPYMNYINEASERISETIRSVDTAVKKLKNPFFFIGDKSKKNEITQFMKALEENNEAILLSDGLTIEQILDVKNIPLDASMVASLWEQLQRYESYVKETLGITSNENLDKKERLLVDEVNANNASTDMNLDIRLRARQEFCRDLNEQFGWDVKVKIRHQEMVKEFGLSEEPEEKEDENDEQVV